MANTNIQHHTEGFSLGAWIERAKANLRVARARRAAYDQTYRELSFMTDRELNDIGLSRAEIIPTAKRAAALV